MKDAEERAISFNPGAGESCTSRGGLWRGWVNMANPNEWETAEERLL
jgi:hypothetical protein